VATPSARCLSAVSAVPYPTHTAYEIGQYSYKIRQSSKFHSEEHLSFSEARNNASNSSLNRRGSLMPRLLLLARPPAMQPLNPIILPLHLTRFEETTIRTSDSSGARNPAEPPTTKADHIYGHPNFPAALQVAGDGIAHPT
jgi:hypothetical protein